MYTSLADFSGWFRLKRKSHKTLISYDQNLCFLNFTFERAAARQPPLWVSQCMIRQRTNSVPVLTGMTAQDKPCNMLSFPSGRGASGAHSPQKRLHSDTHTHAQLLEKLNDYYCRCVCGRRVLSYRLVNGRGQHAERIRSGATLMPFGRSVQHAARSIPTPQSDSRCQRPGRYFNKIRRRTLLILVQPSDCLLTLRPQVVWDITQRRLAVTCRRFETTYRVPYTGGGLELPVTWKWDPIGCPETSLITVNLTCITSQKSEISFTPRQKPEITYPRPFLAEGLCKNSTKVLCSDVK